MEEYLSPGQLIQIAGMFGDAVYNEIVEEHRDRMIGLAERFDWPAEIIPLITNIEGYNVGILEQRLEKSSRNEGHARRGGGAVLRYAAQAVRRLVAAQSYERMFDHRRTDRRTSVSASPQSASPVS
jgi:hypothetical protein